MKRKCLSVVLMVLMLFSLVVPNQVLAATKPKLSKAKATMEVDSTLTLKLGDIAAKDVKWSSSKRSVATVSAKGTITAKSEGTATIKAKYDNATYTCKVTVVDSNKKENKIETYLKNAYGTAKYKEEEDGVTTELYAKEKSLIFAMTFEQLTGEMKKEVEESMGEYFDLMEDALNQLLDDLKENAYKDAKLVFRIYSNDKVLLYEKTMK